jgi:hypothetical protein
MLFRNYNIRHRFTHNYSKNSYVKFLYNTYNSLSIGFINTPIFSNSRLSNQFSRLYFVFLSVFEILRICQSISSVICYPMDIRIIDYPLDNVKNWRKNGRTNNSRTNQTGS